MWQGWRVYSLIHSFIFHPVTRCLIIYSLTEVVLNRAWSTRNWEGSWECRFQLRMSWIQQSVPPRTWHRWVWGGWGRSASCHPGRPGSGEAGAGRQSRRRCRQELLQSSFGRARARCTSSPPSDCPAAECPTARQQGGQDGQSMRGVGGH